MIFFSLRFGRRQRGALLVVFGGVLLALAGWGLYSFSDRPLRQEEAVLPVSVQATDKGDASFNDGRLDFLQGLGFQTEQEPDEVTDVLIPETFDTVYESYNTLQKQQGYDLEKLKGKKVKRYQYKILNYPQRASAVATLLVYKGEIVGGDVTVAGETAQVRGLSFPDNVN